MPSVKARSTGSDGNAGINSGLATSNTRANEKHLTGSGVGGPPGGTGSKLQHTPAMVGKSDGFRAKRSISDPS